MLRLDGKRLAKRVAAARKDNHSMAWKRVARYSLGYNIVAREFYFYYRLEGETGMQQIFPSPEEFLALADMFTDEGPVNLNIDGNYFVTATELVGEEETP
jgi:hypothetical protein